MPSSWRRRIALLVVVAGISAACAGAAADTGPQAVVERYVDAFNADDMDAVRELFADHARMTGHPRVDVDAQGIDEIMAVLEVSRGDGAEDAMRISNVEVVDDTVTWDLLFTRASGRQFCSDGHTAVVRDGEIATMEFGESLRMC